MTASCTLTISAEQPIRHRVTSHDGFSAYKESWTESCSQSSTQTKMGFVSRAATSEWMLRRGSLHKMESDRIVKASTQSANPVGCQVEERRNSQRARRASPNVGLWHLSSRKQITRAVVFRVVRATIRCQLSGGRTSYARGELGTRKTGESEKATADAPPGPSSRQFSFKSNGTPSTIEELRPKYKEPANVWCNPKEFFMPI